ncbi:hypothetical protein OSB04_029254 [Centaurea solstitialis]|uniref:DDE Tnp4 domain-containing protein n=1 Tax=Centaurea solstitialis TaxID=347529 RepID=A0AA38SPT2_9ASTR|nr:hypothetical protein OSB04_029254 [Centaurea solstitialis]
MKCINGFYTCGTILNPSFTSINQEQEPMHLRRRSGWFGETVIGPVIGVECRDEDLVRAEYLACYRGAKSLNPSSNLPMKRGDHPQPSHPVSHIGASRHCTGIRTRLLLRENPPWRRQRRQELLEWFNDVVRVVVFIVVSLWIIMVKRQRDRRQIRHFSSNVNLCSVLHKYVNESYTMSISQIRTTRLCFKKLCDMLETYRGLRTNRFINIEEHAAIFFHIIAHNVKNQVMVCHFHRSGDTITRVVSIVCNAIIRLHPQLLKKAEPVLDNSTDQRWKWFKIKCLVPLEDKPRYRTRKNEIATNVLGVLPGWEGSVADGRVLRDALLRPHGLKVPRPGYYLVDVGYTNGEGFLAPYRGQRYHLNDWRGGHQPTTPKEFFNMKHSTTRNVIERCFGMLKARWGILRDNSYYPIDSKVRIIMACCLLHNFLMREMLIDPFDKEDEVDEGTGDLGVEDGDNINVVCTSNESTTFRDNLAQPMFDSWNATN